MLSLFIMTAIMLHLCHQSSSFTTNSRQTIVRHQDKKPSTSLFSTAAAIPHVDDSNMRHLLFSPPHDSPSAVLVDAYTQWCGPCKLIEPLIKSTAVKYSNQLSILKYDVEGSNNHDLKVEMLLQGVRVSGLPTLIFYWKGQVVSSHSGIISKEELDRWLEVHLFSNDALDRDVGKVMMNEEMTSREADDDNVSEATSKRGFVSFTSLYGKDDYAL